MTPQAHPLQGVGLARGGLMRDDESDRYNRGVLLALFVGAIAASIVIVACLGWGSTVLP